MTTYVPTSARIRLTRARSLIPPLSTVPTAVYIGVLLVIPGVSLILYSFYTSGFYTVIHSLTSANYHEVFTVAVYWQLLLKSWAVGLIVASIITVCAFTMAYAMRFSLGRWGPRLLILVMATLLSSYIVRIFAWMTILGTNGLTNTALHDLGLISHPLSFLLYGYFAIALVLVYVYLPLAVLPIYAALQGIDPRVLEASRDLGATRLQTLRRMTIPLAMHGIRIAFAVSFIFAASDYVTPTLVGGLDGQMAGNVIQDQFTQSGNYPLGAALAVLLVAGFPVILGGLAVTMRVLGRAGARIPRRSGRRHHPDWLTRATDAASRVPYAGIVTGLLMVFLAAPLLTVIFFSFNNSPVPGLPFEGFTLHWYSSVFSSSQFLSALRTSLEVAGLAVVVAILLGTPAAFGLARRRSAATSLVNTVVFAPIAVPGVMIGIALLTTLDYSGIQGGVYPTVAAHVLLICPFVVLVVRSRLTGLEPNIEEAARDLGARRMRVFRTILLPLLAAALAGAAILAAAISFDELIVTNFTIGAGATLPVWIFSQARTGLTTAINAIAVLLFGGSLGLITLTALLLRLQRSRRLTDTLLAEA
jgi:ABC-type spermidine/putrescine transport system permease subunit II